VDEDLLLQFERLEETHWWFRGRRLIVRDTLERWTPPDPRRIVEVGCGTGGLLLSLQSRWPAATVTGVEVNPRAVARARERGCDAREGRFEELPVEPGSTDLLLALDVLEHLADDRPAVAAAREALRPGGRLILTVPALPALWSSHDEVNDHYRRYERPPLTRLVSAAGFRVDRTTFFNTLLLPLAVLERAVLRRLGRRPSLGLTVPPRPVNEALREVLALEAALLRRRDLPVGLSLLLVATRPGGDGRDGSGHGGEHA